MLPGLPLARLRLGPRPYCRRRRPRCMRRAAAHDGSSDALSRRAGADRARRGAPVTRPGFHFALPGRARPRVCGDCRKCTLVGPRRRSDSRRWAERSCRRFYPFRSFRARPPSALRAGVARRAFRGPRGVPLGASRRCSPLCARVLAGDGITGAEVFRGNHLLRFGAARRCRRCRRVRTARALGPVHEHDRRALATRSR